MSIAMNPEPLTLVTSPARLAGGVRPPRVLIAGLLLVLAVQGLALTMLRESPARAPASAAFSSATDAPDNWLPETNPVYMDAANALLAESAAVALAEMPQLFDASGLNVPGLAGATTAVMPPRLAAHAVVVPMRPVIEPVTAADAVEGAVAAPADVVAGTPPAPIAGNADWFAAADARAYTLQLVSARNQNAVSDFYAEQTVDGPLALLRLTVNDATWYAVVTGHHPDLDSAIAAAEAYKQRTGNEAWVRRIRAIQAEQSETLASRAGLNG